MAVRARGVIVLQDILDLLEAIVMARATPYRRLFDARELSSSLNETDRMVLAYRVRASPEFGSSGPFAAVATMPETSAAILRFKSFGDGGRPFEVFGTEESARAWLASHR